MITKRKIRTYIMSNMSDYVTLKRYFFIQGNADKLNILPVFNSGHYFLLRVRLYDITNYVSLCDLEETRAGFKCKPVHFTRSKLIPML